MTRTATADFRRLVILSILTALAIMICDRLSEAEMPKASKARPRRSPPRSGSSSQRASASLLGSWLGGRGLREQTERLTGQNSAEGSPAPE